MLTSSPGILALGQAALSPLLSLGLNEGGNGSYTLNMLFLHCNVGKYYLPLMHEDRGSKAA